MSLPPPIFDGFFRNPFGGERNPIGGMGGEGGVLENIQQQVSENGQALQALQGGIGGLPNTPFQPAINQPIAYENPSRLPDLLDLNPPTSVADAASDIDSQLRAEYEKAVADAKRQRAEGMLGRVVLPGEMSFEDFKQNQMAVANSGAPLQTQMDLFNIGQPVATVEQNPGIGLIQDPGISYTTGKLYNDTSTGSPQLLNSTLIPTGVINQDRLPSGSLRGNNPIPQPIYERPGPDIGMDQLFGRAFAGKPV
jgi:hypothetical protein